MTATKTRKPIQPVHGSCRWLGGIPTAVDLDAGEALLRIVTDKGVEALYFVERLSDAGKVVGYTLTKKDGESYDVDATFGGGVLVCQCPDATYRDRQCKHSKALVAGLKAAGLPV
jgi:hypothetical protein